MGRRRRSVAKSIQLSREVVIKQHWRILLVSFILALATLAVGVNSYEALHSLLWGVGNGWGAERQGDHYVVKVGDASVFSSALQNGDEVVTYDGKPFTSPAQDIVRSYHARHGDTYTIKVRRNGELLPEMTLLFTRYHAPLPQLLRRLVADLLVPLVTLVIALVVFVLKPHDRQAVLLATALGVSVGYTGNLFGFMAYVYPRWFVILLSFCNFVSAIFPAVLIHFFLVFPQPSPLLKRVPRLIALVYLFYLLLDSPYMLMLSWRAVFNPEHVSGTWDDYSIFNKIGLTVMLLMLAGALVALIVNYRHADKLARRKLRIVLAGTLAAQLPFLLWITISFTLEATGIIAHQRRPAWFQVWIGLAVDAAALFMPLSFAYAIIKHQVIPVSLIIRRGLQYLLAKNALRALIALPVIGLALTIIFNPNRTLTDILFRNSFYFYLLLLAAITLGLVFRKRLSVWIDHKFFREAYNQEKILRGLLDEMKHLDSIPEMSRCVTEEVGRALHPRRSYLFYRAGEKRELSLTFTSGGTSQELRIPEDFRLLRFMEDQGAAQEFPFPQKNNLPQSEKVWLEQLDARLIVPMCGTDGRLAGLFLLGDKMSEVPYTGTDRALLEAVAGQIALVYENVRLKERVAQDRKIKHEVLARIEGRDINLLKECPACGACYDSAALVCAKDKSELTLTLPVERNIDNRYRLDQLIGKGGMGAVYEALDERLNRQVAVKILTGSMFGNREALRRFEREAQASARIHHPNVINVHDYGALETEGAYLVMELAHGETLGARLKREHQLPPQVAADLFSQVLAGISAAHALGVVHRDLKPENVLLSPTEDTQTLVRLLDFGLAKVAQPNLSENIAAPQQQQEVTTPGTVMGTFGYMSPEQLMGGEVDVRSDLFSIGVMIVEALTGQRPFTGKTFHELLTNILQGSFHLQDSSPEARRLDMSLQKCLAKDRAERYVSAAEMQKELIPAIRNCRALAFTQESASLEANTFILKR